MGITYGIMNILVVPGVGHVIILIVLIIIHIVHQIGVRRIRIVQLIVIPIRVGPIRVGVGIDNVVLDADDLLDHNLSLGAVDLRLYADAAFRFILVATHVIRLPRLHCSFDSLPLLHRSNVCMVPTICADERPANGYAGHTILGEAVQHKYCSDVVLIVTVDNIGNHFADNTHCHHTRDETRFTKKCCIPGVSRPLNIRNHGLVEGQYDVVKELNDNIMSLVLRKDDRLMIHHRAHGLREEVHELIAVRIGPCRIFIRSVEAQDRQDVLCRLAAHFDGIDFFVGFLQVHNSSPFSCCWCYYHPLHDPS